MALIVPNVVRCSFRGQWTNGEPVVNVLDVDITGGGIVSRDEAKDATFPDLVQNWQTQMLDVFANNYTFIGMDWVDLDSEEGEVGFEPPDAGSPVVGAISTASAPPSVATIVNKICSSRTRGRRNGRWYLPLATEANIDENGAVAASTVTSVLASCNAFRSNVNQSLPLDTRNVTIGVVSNPVEAGLPVLFMPITSFSVRPLVGTQRRRMASLTS